MGRMLRAVGIDLDGPVASRLREAEEIVRWRLAGRPAPPPDRVKRAIIAEHADRFGLQVLVETGTYLGGTVASLLDRFQEIHSIELDAELHRRAVELFRDHDHVHLLQGDSATRIRDVLVALREPALFWLDAHWSAGFSARGDQDTPISTELDAVLAHQVEGHVVLIDDARYFDGSGDYPTIAELRASVERAAPKSTFQVEYDIIRILPTRAD